MNPNTPYNSGTLKNMVQKVRVYCAKIIPLVFDNTLSYYESLCACVAKVNELCDAVNAQNLTITEFTHLVEVELDKLSKYIDAQIEDLQTTLDDHENRINNNTADITALKEFREWITNALTGIINTLNEQCLFKRDITQEITEGDTTHVPSSGAVYEALQQGGGGTIPDATTTTKGKVQIGDNINVSNGVISVPDASALTKGVMTVGSGLSANQGLVYLAQASDSAIGGVKIGDGLKNDVNDKLTIDSDATLAINQNGKLTVRTATPDNVGLATIDGTNSNLTMAYGKIDVPTGSKNTKGVLQVGSNINVGSGVISVPTATPGTLGVATIADAGSNLTMGAGGVIDVPNATQYTKGVVQASDNIEIANGAISVPDATQSKKGVVMLDAAVTQSSGNVPTSGAVYDAIQSASGTVPDATTTTKGKVQIGDNINVSSGVISVPDATQYTKGVVQASDNIEIANGAISVPDATQSKKGVVMLDAAVTQSSGNVPTSGAVYDAIQAASGTVPDATTTTKGKVQIGDNINVSSGVISVPDASALTKGVMTVGSGLSANQGLVYLAQASDSAIGGVKIGDGLKNDVNDKLTIDSDATLAINQNGKLTVRTATPDNVGLATINGTNSNLTLAYGKLDVPTGSRDTKGVLQVGSNINVGNGVISVPTATPGTLGVATIADTGSNLTMGAGGVIDVPTASTSTKGVVGLTDSVTSGDTSNVPTSDAVYQAIQNSSDNALKPIEFGTSFSSDAFVTVGTDLSNPSLISTNNLIGNTIITNLQHATSNYLTIWLKKNVFGISTVSSAKELVTAIPQLYTTASTSGSKPTSFLTYIYGVADNPSYNTNYLAITYYISIQGNSGYSSDLNLQCFYR